MDGNYKVWLLVPVSLLLDLLQYIGWDPFASQSLFNHLLIFTLQWLLFLCVRLLWSVAAFLPDQWNID